MYGKKLHIIIDILICMLISIAAAEEVKQVKSIKVKKNSVTVTYNETCNPEITIAPEDATNPKLDWASTDESVCIVKDGMLYATGAGSCEVTFTTADGSNKSVKVWLLRYRGHDGRHARHGLGEYPALTLKAARL